MKKILFIIIAFLFTVLSVYAVDAVWPVTPKPVKPIKIVTPVKPVIAVSHEIQRMKTPLVVEAKDKLEDFILKNQTDYDICLNMPGQDLKIIQRQRCEKMALIIKDKYLPKETEKPIVVVEEKEAEVLNINEP